MNICFTKNYNLFVSYYNQNKIKILNCYDLAETSSEFYLDKLVKEIQKDIGSLKETKEINRDFLSNSQNIFSQESDSSYVSNNSFNQSIYDEVKVFEVEEEEDLIINSS